MTSIQPVCPNCAYPCSNCNQNVVVNPEQPTVSNYSGVSIDIHNPSVNVPPYSSIYDMPKTNIYTMPNNVEDVVNVEEV